ncbi:MAG: hypothetical protein RLZZ245_3204 [Verrucomicrobiota bacterium]|jgi:hypothetical protein
MTTDYEDILIYAKKVKDTYPMISSEDLQKALAAHFIGGKDTLSASSAGCVADPIGDYIAMLSIVFNSVRKVITQDKDKLIKLQEKIDQAVHELNLIR